MFFLFLLVSMIITIKADCNCGNYMGVHCGERATDQSSGLKGDCNKDAIYQCPAPNVPAQSKGYCSYCAKSEKLGTDYCTIGREGISKLSFHFTLKLFFPIIFFFLFSFLN